MKKAVNTFCVVNVFILACSCATINRGISIKPTTDNNTYFILLDADLNVGTYHTNMKKILANMLTASIELF